MRSIVFLSAALFVACLDPVALAQEPRRVVRASVLEYPYLMFASGIEGRFLVALTVSPSGDVSGVEMLESPAKYFDAEILDHVRRWTFEPEDGTSSFSIEFVFRLLPKEAPIEERGVFFFAPTTIEIRTRRRPPIVDW